MSAPVTAVALRNELAAAIGRIWCESTSADRTAFVVELPTTAAPGRESAPVATRGAVQ